MTQGGGQRTVAAHGVSHDRLPAGVDRKMLGNKLRQFLGHVTPHQVIAGEGRFCRVDIKARTQTEIVGIGGIARYVFATWARIGRDEDEPVFGAGVAKLTFLRHVGMGAGQP